MASFHCNSTLDHIYISEDYKFIVGLTSSPAKAQLGFPIPPELWKHKLYTSSSLKYFDRSNVHADGWLYSEEQEPRSRVCWVPAASRPVRFKGRSDYGDIVFQDVKPWIKDVYITQSGTVGHIIIN